MGGQIIEGTITLVLAYLVIANADKFSTAAQAVGTVYTDAVKALQGRQFTDLTQAVLAWIASRPAALDGFIGGFISSIIVVTIYDRWAIVRRHRAQKEK